MRVSEWGDILSSSSGEEGEGSSSKKRVPPFCVCLKCSQRRAAEESNPTTSSSSPSGAPPTGPPQRSSSSYTQQPAGGPSPARAAPQQPESSSSSSSRCAAAEGVPVSLMMLQYPLFFCDIDLPFTLELKRSWREVGGLAFWTLSSAKEGNGVEALRDNNSQTFWQSEGQAPHTITLQFPKEIKLARVDLLVSLQQDESYTPKRVQIKLAIEAVLAQCDPSEFLAAACLQIVILSTHQQGRDTHVRQVRVYGPMEDGGADGEGPDTAMPSRTTTAVHGTP
ncbi:hypothetical protein Emag_000088 [Eimeria magna]